MEKVLALHNLLALLDKNITIIELQCLKGLFKFS